MCFALKLFTTNWLLKYRIERRTSFPLTLRPGATSVRRYLPKPLSRGLPAVMNFVTLENTDAIAALPAPIAAYCSGQLFDSVSLYVHAIDATCSAVAWMPCLLLISGFAFRSK